MSNLQKNINMLEENGQTVKIAPAPKDAQSFDTMLVVYSDPSCRTIRRVIFYDTKKDTFVAAF